MPYIDIRDVPTDQHQQRLLHAFNALQVGDELEVIASDEPLDLYDVLEDNAAGTFTWKCFQNEQGSWWTAVRKTSSTAGDEVRVLTADANYQVIRVELAAGTCVPEQHVLEGAVVVVTAGSVRVARGTESIDLAVGEVIRLPPEIACTIETLDGATVVVVRV